MTAPAVLVVSGLRDQVSRHWQTLLEAHLRERGAVIECALQPLIDTIVLVAHRKQRTMS
jgi:hypothetical protein